MNSIKNIVNKLNCILTKKQKSLGVIVLLGSVFSAILETLGVSIIVPLVNALLQPQELLNNYVFASVCNSLKISTNNEIVAFVIGGVIVVYIIKNIYFIFFSWLKNKYACMVQRETSIYMLKSYMNRGYTYFLDHNANEIRQGVEYDVNYLYNVITSLIQIIAQFIMSLMICIYMCISDWTIATSVIIASLLCLFLIFAIFRKRMTLAGLTYRKYNILAGKVLLETLHGFKEVFVSRKQRYFLDSYKENITEKQSAQVKQYIGEEIPAYIIEAVCISCIMVILAVRMINIDNPAGFVAILASFAVGAFRVLPALGKISTAINTISASQHGLNAVYENIISAREFNNSYEQVDAMDIPSQSMDSFNDCIRANNISFSYDIRTGNVLNNLNLCIPKGSSVALVGESGSGKTTFSDILLGLLPVTSGDITIDDIDIHNIPVSWSHLIGFVAQSIYLFDSTIKENIAFGINPDKIDMNQISYVLKKANLWDFVRSLPDGVDTIVGDRGVKLSGGQRQRIGIARALYSNPQILVLDEATSALDNETEKSVMEAIESLQGDITMVIIAHRLTTIRNCDYIYEIRDGQATPVKYEDIC